MKKYIFYLLAIAAIILTSCDKVVVNHTNPYDPLSPDYKPTRPKSSSILIYDDHIDIKWKDNSQGALGFIISRNYESEIIDTIAADRSASDIEYSYRDSIKIELGEYYNYSVAAYSRNNVSSPLYITKIASLLAPMFKVIYTISPNSAKIEWEPRGTTLQIERYILERKKDSASEDFSTYATIMAPETTFTEEQLDTTSTYSYRLYLATKYRQSAYSKTVTMKYTGDSWQYNYSK